MLLYIFLGIIFITVFLPILESITSIILSALEIIKGLCSRKIAKISADIELIKLNATNISSKPVAGFTSQNENKDYDLKS